MIDTRRPSFLTALSVISLILHAASVAHTGESTKARQESTRIDIRILDAKGKTLAHRARAAADGWTELRYGREFRKGDRVVVRGPSYIRVRVDRVREALVYCPDGVWEFAIPFERRTRAYPSFAGNRHHVRVSAALPADLARLKNLALNPYDLADRARAYPHVTTNSVCRQDPVFAARNAIDGEMRAKGHGKWPHQSWGPDMKAGLWWKLDFGRPVELHRLEVILRADVPHDKFFQGATAVFPDGTREPLKFRADGSRQGFRFSPRTITWVELRDFVLPQPAGWCAVTEVSAWGREASGYAKKATWRSTLTRQFYLGPEYVIA